MAEPIRVFVGTEEKTEIARKVLEFSIEQHTDALVEFVPMIGPQWEYSLDGITVGTGFSLRRWMIPAFCNWQGRAIYLDADQLVFADIQDLWDSPDVPQLNAKGRLTAAPAGASVWCTYQPDKYSKTPWPQTSVMVIDCEQAKGEWGWELNEILDFLRKHPGDRKAYAAFMHCMLPPIDPKDGATWTKKRPMPIDTGWNDLNEYRHGKTKLLHYTKEPDQPWYKPDHPHAKHWKASFIAAFKSGRFTREEVVAAVGNFGKKEDWRPTNGLHPSYLELLKG